MSVQIIEKYSQRKIKARKNETKADFIRVMTHLYLNGRNIAKIIDLTACQHLKVLYMHNNAIEKIENLQPNLRTLTHLYLQWNRIKTIENFDNLTNLKKLYLGHNEITELNGLCNLDNLEELHIENQNLPKNIEFEFDVDCLEYISKTLKTLNISKLNLTSLKPIEILYRIENLIATDNLFESSKDIGLSLGYLIFLKNAHLENCPAQKETHFREQITASTFKLQTLDGKDISNHAREFIKKFEQMKLESKSRKNKVPSDETVNIEKPVEVGNISKSLMELGNIGGPINYQKWMSLNPPKRRCHKKSIKTVARICSAKPDLDGELMGRNLLN